MTVLKMKIIITIQFKSEPDFFDKEHSGIKNNTVRFVTKEEDKKILSIIDNIKYIRITNTDNRICTTSFTRSLTDITRYVNPQDLKVIYIFTWEV